MQTKEYCLNINNKKISLQGYTNDFICKNIWANGLFYEQDFLEYTANNIKNPKIIIDCGAHIGNHTLFWAFSYPKVKIYSFEPQSDNFLLLDLNTQLFRDRITIFNIALGCEEKKVIMGLIPGFYDMGCYQTVQSDITVDTKADINNISPKTVEMKTLDSFNLKPDIIKIDVEYDEYNVLLGAIKTIKKHKPIIFVEANDELYKEFLKDNFLNNLNYKETNYFENGGKLYEFRYKA